MTRFARSFFNSACPPKRYSQCSDTSNSMTMKKSLIQELKSSGWTEIIEDWEYRKNNWTVLRDTSSWLMVGTESNPRAFDIHEPGEYETKWTANLIEHICKMEDERTRLRRNLEQINSITKESHISELTRLSLEECYHTWIGTGDNLVCPVCKTTKKNE